MAKTPTEIKSLARAHTESALNVLAGIMNKSEAPETARVSAATALLDRGWGKPAQAIKNEDDETLKVELLPLVRKIVDPKDGSNS
jgi:hypothetical protein